MGGGGGYAPNEKVRGRVYFANIKVLGQLITGTFSHLFPKKLNC